MNIGIWDENSFNLIYSIYLLKTGASNESGVKSLVRVKNGFALGKRKDLFVSYNLLQWIWAYNITEGTDISI